MTHMKVDEYPLCDPPTPPRDFSEADQLCQNHPTAPDPTRKGPQRSLRSSTERAPTRPSRGTPQEAPPNAQLCPLSPAWAPMPRTEGDSWQARTQPKLQECSTRGMNWIDRLTSAQRVTRRLQSIISRPFSDQICPSPLVRVLAPGFFSLQFNAV